MVLIIIDKLFILHFSYFFAFTPKDIENNKNKHYKYILIIICIMKLSHLPDDIINLIKEFITYKILVFVNKTFYNLYHHTIKSSIKLYENYVRDMIRRDNDFVFEKILGENINLWLKNKQYRYKNMVFNNYIYFIINYCIENNSDNCRKILTNYLKKRDLCRNLHKKNVVKYIKWTN